MILKIALLQLLPGKDLNEQLEIGNSSCKKAKEMGADIALFPEMWSTGYVIPQDEKELNARAISKDSYFIDSFRKLAKELRMAIGITFLEQNDPKPLNSMILFDRNGGKGRRSCLRQTLVPWRSTDCQPFAPGLMKIRWRLLPVTIRRDNRIAMVTPLCLTG